MALPTKRARPFLVAVLVIAVTSGAAWYQQDRIGMFSTLCNAGLPNLSRPSVVRKEDIGCEILGPRRLVSGMILNSGTGARFLESNLPPAPKNVRIGATTVSCNQSKGCDKRENLQYEEKIPGLYCAGIAKVVAFGWATETPAQYGHAGGSTREFFQDEVVTVGRPSASFIAKFTRNMPEANDEWSYGECP